METLTDKRLKFSTGIVQELYAGNQLIAHKRRGQWCAVQGKEHVLDMYNTALKEDPSADTMARKKFWMNDELNTCKPSMP